MRLNLLAVATADLPASVRASPISVQIRRKSAKVPSPLVDGRAKRNRPATPQRRPPEMPDMRVLFGARRAVESRCFRDNSRVKTRGYDATSERETVCPDWVAVREGFEPSIGFHLYTRSRRAPSTTRPPHQRPPKAHAYSTQEPLRVSGAGAPSTTRPPHQPASRERRNIATATFATSARESRRRSYYVGAVA
jgi:hypothetical protein